MSKNKYKITDPPIKKEVCEFIGVIIGDGSLTKFQRTGRVQITGDPNLDYEYYNKYLSILIHNLFGIQPRIHVCSSRLNLTIYSIELFDLINKKYEIPFGHKSFIVKIPKIIMDDDISLRCACIRGLFDTDGGVGIDKRKIYAKPYLRVNFVSSSCELIKQVSATFDELNIPHSIHTKNNGRAFQIQINGIKNVKNYLHNIGFSNSRHSNKIVKYFNNINS